MAIDLRTTQEYLNDKLGTVGLTKQQCIIRLAGNVPQNATRNEAWNNYAPASVTLETAQDAANDKIGNDKFANLLTIQEVTRRL